MSIPMRLYEVEVCAVLDSGAWRSVLPLLYYNSIHPDVRPPLQPSVVETLLGVGPGDVPVLGKAQIPVNIRYLGQYQVDVDFLVADIAGNEVILGHPFLIQAEAHLDFGKRHIILFSEEVPYYQTEASAKSHAVRIARTVVVDTGQECMVKGNVHPGAAARGEKQQHPDQQIYDNLQSGFAQRSHCSWALPIVMVYKKDGTYLLCIDYRALNDRTITDAYLLPRIQNTLDILSTARWFSTLDLASGHWQVELTPRARRAAAFCTRTGLFEWNVMPFGLCNALATFQRLMDRVLAGMRWETCLVYLDDIIELAKDVSGMLQRLGQVFYRLQQASLKVKPAKYCLFRREVAYLGHVVSEHGVATDPSKVQKVQMWPTPTSIQEVRRFIGLASYCRWFVKDFASIAEPLHTLTKKNAHFQWHAEHQAAFDKLKCRLTSAPVLGYPIDHGEMILDNDDSDTGIGAVLSQMQQGVERVLAYGSHERAATVAEVIASEWVCCYGIPQAVHSDQGCDFESEVFQGVCSLFGIDKTHKTPFQPQSDGQVERFNATLQKILASTAEHCHWDWDLMIPYAVMAYRATKHSATGFTPNFMMFGRELSEPVDLVAGLPPDPDNQPSAPEYVQQMLERLELAHLITREALRESVMRTKRQYDKNCCHTQYKTGDPVWYLIKGTRHIKNKVKKFLPSYEGPFFVLGQLDDLVYRIQKNPRSKMKVVHHDQLKHYCCREPLDNT
ncbi:unnamed protein product [Oreochromis niloticus]|nr:unnamed protein product [Mustela putorius furo]